MRHALRHLLSVLFFALLAGGAGYGWHVWRTPAEAHEPETEDVVERTSPAEPEEAPDARLSRLTPRADGARKLLAAEAGETLLRIGFADNRTLVISATATKAGGDRYRLAMYDVKDGKTVSEMEGSVERYASSHRPAHKNADRFCWSERVDGKLEAFCSDFAGKRARRLTTHDGPEDILDPAISPDGSWVVFEVNTDRQRKPSGSSIWKIGLTGAGLQQLTRGGDDRHPTWSEDGSRVYFQRRFTDGNWDLYSIKSDGSDPRPILRTFDQDEAWPARIARGNTMAAAVGPKGVVDRLKILDMVTKSASTLTGPEFGPISSVTVTPDGKIAAFLAPLDPADPGRLAVWLRAIE
jgi:hypothetical protein